MSASEHLGEDLAAFIGLGDGLSAETRAGYEAHLSDCPDCRAEVEAMRQLQPALEAPPITPSPDFDARLFARLDALDRAGAREARRAALRGLFRPARWGWLLAPVAAGVGWFVLGRPGPGPGSVDRAAPSAEGLALAELEGLELGGELELLAELDAAEYLDVAEDLELLLADEEGEPG